MLIESSDLIHNIRCKLCEKKPIIGVLYKCEYAKEHNVPIIEKDSIAFIMKFIKTYFVTYNKTGCRFLTVDAYYEAIPFYQKNGFIPLNEADAHDKTRLLYFDLNDVSD